MEKMQNKVLVQVGVVEDIEKMQQIWWIFGVEMPE